MRRPTALGVQYEWHSMVLRNESPAIHPDHPECGWYKIRLIKDGPWVPARIWLYSPTDEHGNLTADETFQCEINGKPANAEASWIWLTPISEEEWKYLEDLRLWAKEHAPNDPAAKPHEKVDPLKAPIPF